MENCQLYYSGKGILREDRCSKIILTVFSQKKKKEGKERLVLLKFSLDI